MLSSLFIFWLGGVLSCSITVFTSKNHSLVKVPLPKKIIYIIFWPYHAIKGIWYYGKGLLTRKKEDDE